MRASIAILGASALLASCGGSHEPQPIQAGNDVAGIPVLLEEIQVYVPVEGTVVARNRAEIATRMMARVAAIDTDVGAHVRQGQVLVRLGAEDIAANRAKAEAGVTAAQAGRDEAARHLARMDTLLAQDVVPRVQRDQAELMMTQAEAQVALAAATLREVETAATYASIRAPFHGVVVARYVDQGDLSAPGMPLLVVEEAGPRDGRLSVPVAAAEGLEPGMPIRVSTLDGRAAQAPVRTVAGGADPMSRTVEVRVTLPADWPTGVSVSALVPVGTAQAITVPASAVVRRGQLTGVQVVTPDGVAIRWVRLGRSVGDGDRVEVLSGLSAGDRIVL
jgi:RND family efflux transporter MFP subunit